MPAKESASARHAKLHDAVAALHRDLPKPLALGECFLGVDHGVYFLVADGDDNVARLEPEGLGRRTASDRCHGHTLCLVNSQLVGDGWQNVRYPRAIERIVAGDISGVVLTGLGRRNQRKRNIDRLPLAYRGQARRLADALCRQPVVHGPRVCNLDAVDMRDDVALFEARVRRRALVVKAGHDRTGDAIETQALGNVVRHPFEFCADPRPLDLAHVRGAFGVNADKVRRDREPDADRAARLRVDHRVMPTSRPAMSTSAPPELPGLMAASVWMKTWLSDSAISERDSAETMPLVTVWPTPNGLPI